MLYAIWDQLKKCNRNILQALKTPHELCLHVCSKLKHQLEENHIFGVQTFTPETWLHKMIKDKTWCDDAFLQITANIFNRNIILIPLSPSSAHHAGCILMFVQHMVAMETLSSCCTLRNGKWLVIINHLSLTLLSEITRLLLILTGAPNPLQVQA